MPLAYRPGELAEVDFFEVLVDVAGKRRKAWMFVMRLMYSGRDYARLYERQDQVSFLDAHVRAFEHFGAVPQRIAYDNLKPAVVRVLAGSERELSARFLAMATHYVFEPCFAATGHDKGGVEARGKAIRRQELVPIPSAESLDAISEALLARLDQRTACIRDGTNRSIADGFVQERAQMLPLPQYRLDARAVVLVEATRRSLSRVEGAYYSVPSQWAGLSVTAYIGPSSVVFAGPDGQVEHPRMRFGERSIDYRHYLSELARKPQALRQVAPELIAQLGPPFERLWRELVDEQGPRDGARVFARVLGALTTLGEAETRARIERARQSGEPLSIALRTTAAEPAVPLSSLPKSLVDVEVHAASAADYDALLGGGER